jgi:hypothetical protein
MNLEYLQTKFAGSEVLCRYLDQDRALNSHPQRNSTNKVLLFKCAPEIYIFILPISLA